MPQTNCYVLEIVYEQEEEKVNYEGVARIDLGMNNLMAVTTNQTGIAPLLINGKPLKAINTFYNKQRFWLQSKLKLRNNQEFSPRLERLTQKRNCRVENYLHTASKRVVDWCRKNEIGMLIIGHNEHWKQGIKGWPFNPVMLDPLRMNRVSDL